MAFQVEVLKFKTDPRGGVCEPLDQSMLALMRNMHVVINAPGSIRGNHAHVSAQEIVVVFGPALVRIRQQGRPQDFTVPSGEAWRFVLPPGVSHAFQNTGSQPAIILAFSTEPHDPQNPRLVSDILIVPAP